MKENISISKVLAFLAKCVLIVIFIFPFLWMIVTAFKTYDETIIYPPTLIPQSLQWVNFKTVWESGPYLMYLKNSLVVTLSILAIQIFVMVPASFSFARYKFKGNGLLFGVVMIAFMIPSQITFISIYFMFAKLGWLKTLLPQILPFGANAFGIFLLRQAFKQVPEEILESARLDNATEMQLLSRVMLPMAKPTLISIMMLAFISHWNDYFWPFVMTNSIEVRPLTIGIAALRSIEGAFDWHIIMAGNVILVMPIVLVYLFFNKKIVNAFVYNGIK